MPANDELNGTNSDGEQDIDWASKAESEEVEPEIDSEAGPITKPWDPALIRVDPRPMSVNQALEMIDQGDLELQPEFQRRRVWNDRQKSLLIESLLLRIPLPAFYFASDENGHLQVIDGLQRLSTIHEFVRGTSDHPEGFKLNDLEYLQSVVGGKRFSDLKGQVWGRRILQASLVANVVDPQTPTQVKFNIFARLNKQGTPLSQQELRHAMSGNRSREFLAHLANLEIFHAATGGTVKNSPRMHDIEMVLRYCAFAMTPYTSYGKYDSLSDFLTFSTSLLDDELKIDNSQLKSIENLFIRSMTNCTEVFGSKAFRKFQLSNELKAGRSPINKPLFETWSFALRNLTQPKLSQVKDKIIRVHNMSLNDPTFFSSISLNTGSTSNVTYRFTKIIKSLENEGTF